MLGLSGWRLMFLIEGMPAVLIGMVAYRLLPDGPAQAPWLTSNERQSLHQAIHTDVAPAAADEPGHRQPIVALAGIYAGLYFGLYAMQFFLPQMIAGLHLAGGAAATSVLAAAPYVLAAGLMLIWSRRCDRNGNQRRHIALPAFAAAAATTIAVGVTGPALAFAALCVATAGILAAVPAFWSMCTARLTGPGVPIAIATVNSVASLASFLGPTTTGWLVDHTGGFQAAMTVIACCLNATGTGALLLTKAPADASRRVVPAAPASLPRRTP
jgi:predicted MFS family arabinose efflux permease